MVTYAIRIKTEGYIDLEVEAKSIQDAEQLGWKMFHNGEIDLSEHVWDVDDIAASTIYSSVK